MRRIKAVERDSGRPSEPTAHPLSVTPPLLAELVLELSFLASNEEIHQREVNGSGDERRRRPEQQGRSEKREHVPAQVERVPRKTIGPGRDQPLLRREGDYAH